MNQRFADRADAGAQLAGAVEELALSDPVVLALPRGGVPVGFEVARRLGAPLDILIVRKLGAPEQRELAIGALAEGGEMLIDNAAAQAVGADQTAIDQAVRREQVELERSVARLRSGRPRPALGGRDVIIVDDGLATGLTAEVAIRVVRRHAPRTVTLAVPVGAPDSVDRLRSLSERVVCLRTPTPFRAVGLWYRWFDQTTAEEVLSMLDRVSRPDELHGPSGQTGNV